MRGIQAGKLSRGVLSKPGIYQRLIDHVFRPMTRGRLVMTLPDGKQLAYGAGKDGVSAEIRVLDNAFFRKCVLFGDVGFGESYVDGDWETDDIAKVIEWMIVNVENHPTLMADSTKKTPVNVLRLANNLMKFARTNTLKGSRRNIHAHYDLGNEFYQLILDPSMTYSSAYYKRDEASLEEAQYNKYEALCLKLKLKASDHMLEIGCGWGSFAIYAAKNFGCRVTALTISNEQFKYARQRVAEEGLAHKIDVQLQDYRKTEGAFDKIASIEMLEAVGHEYYEDYFAQCHRLLKPEGILALQVILSPDHRYPSFKDNMDWIQKHIFPGSLLPSFAVLLENINKTGTLNLLDYTDMTPHYVRTLSAWHRNFNVRAAEIRELGLDESFMRKWNYYWCYCMAAFKTRNIYVAQMAFTRPNNLSL